MDKDESSSNITNNSITFEADPRHGDERSDTSDTSSDESEATLSLALIGHPELETIRINTSVYQLSDMLDFEALTYLAAHRITSRVTRLLEDESDVAPKLLRYILKVISPHDQGMRPVIIQLYFDHFRFVESQVSLKSVLCEEELVRWELSASLMRREEQQLAEMKQRRKLERAQRATDPNKSEDSDGSDDSEDADDSDASDDSNNSEDSDDSNRSDDPEMPDWPEWPDDPIRNFGFDVDDSYGLYDPYGPDDSDAWEDM